MAKEQKPVESLSVDAAAAEQQQSLLGSRAIVIMVLIVLALAQVILMYMLLPNPQSIAKSISDQIPKLPDTLETAGLSAAPTTTVDTRNWIEKKLGEQFKFQNKNKSDPTAYDQVVVTITVRIDRKDEAKFDRIIITRPEKLRDIIYTVLREANEDEITAPNMLSIKQKILIQLNQELSEPFVKEVLCTDMSFSQM
jgi:flagellar basal body-associated protein FliL